MKLNISDNPAQGSGFEQVSGFKIDMNAKAFKVLSDTLYKNKIGSIVRELSCNAFDAHVEAGNSDQPFDIHLPDSFEPYFSIRDYGVGISPQDIKDVYTSYFTSTKDQANDAVGAFGLGSKTPFSYTDSFTVISIHKGVKTMYNAHMSEGMPAIVAYGESEETDEPDGLEVNVSVESVDFKAFASAVKDQLKFFPVKPNIINGQVEWEAYEPIIEVPGFTMYKITSVPNRRSYISNRNILQALFLKQGPVAYPVDFDIINQYLNSNNIKKTKFYKYLETGSNNYGKGIIIDMPIGTVEVTASREGISYSDVTIRNILTKFDAISNMIYKDVERLLDAAYVKGNAAFVKQYNELDSYLKSSLQLDKIEKKFNRFTFSGGMLFPRLKLPKYFEGTEIRQYDIRSYNKPKAILNTTLMYNEDGDNKFITFNMHSIVDTGVVYVKDAKTNFVTRIKNDTIKNYTDNRICNLIDLPDGVTFEQFKDIIGDGIDVYKVSDLEKVKVNRNSNNVGYSTTGGNNRLWFDITAENFTYITVDGNRTLYSIGCKSKFGYKYEDAIEDGQQYVYVATHANKITSEHNNFPFVVNSKLSLFARWLENKDYKLVAIPSNATTKAEKTGSFISFGDAWKCYQKDFIKDQWNIFNDVVLYTYYSCLEKMYSSGYYGSIPYRVNMKQIFQFFDVLNIDYSDIAEASDSVLEALDNMDRVQYNSAMRYFIAEYMPSKLDLFDEIVNKFLTGVSADEKEHSFEAFEQYMKRAGIKPVRTISTAVNKYVDLIKDNAHTLLAAQTVTSIGVTRIEIRSLVIDNPISGSSIHGLLTSDQIEGAVKKNLGIKT